MFLVKIWTKMVGSAIKGNRNFFGLRLEFVICLHIGYPISPWCLKSQICTCGQIISYSGGLYNILITNGFDSKIR